MIKKLIIIIVSICLVLCFSLTVLAENKTIYFEYSGKEENDDLYPKIGFDWQINYNWGFAASHQFEIDEADDPTTNLAIRRAFLDQQLNLVLNYETSGSYDSIGLSANTFFPINDSLGYDGAVSYTTYSAHHNNSGNLDYNLLKIFNGFQYKINDKLSTSISCEWSNYQYDIIDDTDLSSNPDYWKLNFSTGLHYYFNENLSVKGVHSWTDAKYKDSRLNGNWGGFIFGANYTLKNYTFYLEYPFFHKDQNAMIGVSYTF